MYDELFDGFGRLRKIFYAAFFAVLLAGAAAGAMYLARRYGGSDEIKSYLDTAAAGFSGGVDSGSVTVRALKDCMLAAALFFICGFFRPGAAVIAAEIARRGFVTGFTAAAFMRYFGMKGILFSACMLPQTAVMVPGMLMFGSVNAAAALGAPQRTKKFWLAYLIFFVAAATIFCASAICEGFLTTTFMKWAAARVT